MKSEIKPGAGGSTGGGDGRPAYDPHADSSGSDSDDSDSGPNTESLTGSDEFVRLGTSSLDGSMMESEVHQDGSRTESEAHQGDERNTLTSEPGRGDPPVTAGHVEDDDRGATLLGVSYSEQVTLELESLDLESDKGSSGVYTFVDGNVRGSEVGKGLMDRPSTWGNTSSAGKARSEQSTGMKVPPYTTHSRPADFVVGHITENSSRQSLKPLVSSSTNFYNPLVDSSQSSSSSNSPDACDHDKIAEFSESSKSKNEEVKAPSEPSSVVVKKGSLPSASQTLNHSESQTGPSPRPTTMVPEDIATSSVPGNSARSENSSQPGTKTPRVSRLKLQRNPVKSSSLVKAQVSSGKSSPEVFSAQELPQKNQQSNVSVAGDVKLDYASRRLSGEDETAPGIEPAGPDDLSKPTELGTRDTERSDSTSSNECLNKSPGAAAPAVVRRMTRIREKLMQKGGILSPNIKPSPSVPSAVYQVSPPTSENPKTDTYVPFEPPSITVEPKDFQSQEGVRRNNISTSTPPATPAFEPPNSTVEPKDFQSQEGARRNDFSTSTPPATPAFEPPQQVKSEERAPVKNPSRPVEGAVSPRDPDQAIQIYTDGAKMHLKNLDIADIVSEDESGFKFYCKAWFDAIVHERQWQQIKFTAIPSETVEKVLAAYETLRSYVMRIEGIFESYICLPPRQLVEQVSLQHLKGLNQLFPDFKELVESRVKHFAEHYEKRNKEIIQLEGQVIGALIQMCGKYFEEEALHQMESNYFELDPLSELLKPIEQGTRKHFLTVCKLELPYWKNKYSKVLDEEFEQRTSNLKSINEQKRMKTQNEIKEAIDKAVQKYTEVLVEKLKKQTGHTNKRQMAYRCLFSNLKTEISNKVKVEFVRNWGSCPSLYENALKDFEERVSQVNDDQSKKLLEQKPSESYSHQGATSSGITTRSQANSQSNHNTSSTQPGKKYTNTDEPSEGPSSMHAERLRGTTQQNSYASAARPKENATNLFHKPPENPLSMFKDLPVSTLAIHMGLSHTSMGLFRPRTKEFVNFGRVEHMLYYRDDSILLAYDDADREKLGQPDLDFRGLIVDGQVDELVNVDLGGENHFVRKEQIFSSFLAALKWKAELGTKIKLHDCVIVVPQFLNMAQRDCIGCAAKMAGFLDVKFIDDTTAIALKYIMWNTKKPLSVIVISALEGPLDIARFTMKDGIVRRHEISGSSFIKSEQVRNIVSRALNATWTYVYGTTTKESNEIEKMFSYKEFDLGSWVVENEVKVFVGKDEDFENVKAALCKAKNFSKLDEESALVGGAFMASICKWDCLCPIFKVWDSLYTGWGRRHMSSCQEFEREALATKFKEKKRASNVPNAKVVSLSKEDIEKITAFLKVGVEVHDVAMNAVKVFTVIEEAIARKNLCNNVESDVLYSHINAHLLELRRPNRRIEEAKRILDDLLDTWRVHVQGPSTQAMSQK